MIRPCSLNRSVTQVTRSNIGCDYRRGSVALFLVSLFIFALCERENEQQKWMSTTLPKAKSSVE